MINLNSYTRHGKHAVKLSFVTVMFSVLNYRGIVLSSIGLYFMRVQLVAAVVLML